MLPKFFDRKQRATTRVRILEDNSAIVRGNMTQLMRPEVVR